jgi:NAD(P)-dependent dehydrogenase (short-subunit alcohol dehydrogenase family)
MLDTDKKVWLVTGAGRGMGVDIARAALAAGNALVATGHRPEAVEQKARDMLAEVDAYRELSTSLALDDPEPTENRR